MDPRAGGPLESVRQRGVQLRDLGHSVQIVTLDDPEMSYLRGFPITVHALGPSRTGYRYNPRLVAWLRAQAEEFDAVIVDGLWQYGSFAAWRALRNTKVGYFVFPHGMLDAWFARQYPLKHLKKWLYWPWAEYRVLRDAKAVLFTTEQERLSSRESFWLYRANEEVVGLGTKTPPPKDGNSVEKFHSLHPELRGRRCLLFLGRIHEKKGCDLAIRAFAEARQREPDLHLIMAGPDQAGIQGTLQSLAKQLGVAANITWPGMLLDAQKWAAFYCSEAFILPSHQENFGIAVAEALGCGLPVLISDKVYIWREIEAEGAGLIAPDTLEGTIANIRRWLALDSGGRELMGQRALAAFAGKFSLEATTDAFLEKLTVHMA